MKYQNMSKQKRYPRQKYPFTTVGLFILNKKNQLLLIRSYKWRDYYSIPGGKINLGERIEEAVVREGKEEIGLDLEIIKFLCPVEAIFPKEFFKPRHFIFLQYLCCPKGNDVPSIDNKEIQSFVWDSPYDALHKKVDPYCREIIKKYLIPFLENKNL